MHIIPNTEGSSHEVLAEAIDNLSSLAVDRHYQLIATFVKRADGAFDFGEISLVTLPESMIS